MLVPLILINGIGKGHGHQFWVRRRCGCLVRSLQYARLIADIPGQRLPESAPRVADSAPRVETCSLFVRQPQGRMHMPALNASPRRLLLIVVASINGYCAPDFQRALRRPPAPPIVFARCA